ncbi:hypothetical protein FAM18133_01188 [Lacticaseibacillus paracasei]|nr:hypothetical protein FAM18133_01188 [Lacticaseibacillus paracasei]
MAKTGRHYYFVARNEKTKTGYHISFPNIPNAEAVGTTYEETVYYSYRVLADFLSHLPKQEAEIRAYTLSDIPDTVSRVLVQIFLADLILVYWVPRNEGLRA